MKALIALLILYVLGALLSACLPGDPAEPITFVNDTDRTLAFYVGASVDPVLGGVKPLGPRSAIKDSVFLGGGSFSWIRVAATREDGQWVFDRTYYKHELRVFFWTYYMDEWKMAGRRVVVSSLTPIAPPSDVKVVPYTGAPMPVLR